MSDASETNRAARLLPVGDRALLVEVESLDAVLTLHAALAASAPPGVVDLVPAARTVLVQLDPAVLAPSTARTWIGRAVRGETDAAGRSAASPDVQLAITYDGPDLSETARLLGISSEDLVQRHRAAEWTVAFAGFAPGFAYLVSPQWSFAVPRLDSPRTRVPAGAVGLAGEFTGAYPRETPGGWRLIGTTPELLFDPGAESPALLPPGTRVRFVDAGPAVSISAEAIAPASTAPAPTAPASTALAPTASAPAPTASVSMPPVAQMSTASEPERVLAGRGLQVVEPGLLATIQDLGRPGRASQGIARSGALDRAALRTANRLVGNPEGAAAIEVTMGGFRAVAERANWMAVTGAWGDVRIDGARVDPYVAQPWPEGAELSIDWFAHGVRAYVAVRGGLDGPVVAGSRATDILSGLGPPVLRAGQRVAVRADAAGPVPAADLAPWGAPPDEEVVVALGPGPRAEWFSESALQSLYEASWTVTEKADRVGVRLDGPPLERARNGELPSEGMLPGTIQVPPSGLPTVLLADGPVTGGYPVIAVVADASLDAFAQLRPGTRIRFRHAHAAG